ncbi:MAG: GH3 auxin-responsive promoter family protein [Bacteroidia bacterium]
MMKISSLVSWLMKKRMHQIELFMKYPHDVQAEWLMKLVNSAQNTEWGKSYDYKSIRNRETFKKRVPIQDYEDIKPFVKRLMDGEQNILWNTDIKWFSKSSGTTSDKSKFIPVSQEALEECHYKGGKDMLSLYCSNNPDTKIFDGKSLAMGGTHNVISLENESYYGDVSAIIMQNLPYWAEFIRTPNLEIALMDEWEEKIKKMADATVNENVTSMAGVPSWTLVLLRYILEKNGKKNVHDIWPNLEVFFHGAVSFTPYREQYKSIISPKMNYMETYTASEGFFGIQDRKRAEDMLLMLDYGIYYEFLPMDENDKEDAETLSLAEVKTGVNYALIISTNAGLWRYKIGDTVQFTSIDPYRIKVSGRTKHFINAFGEELIIDNADKALKIACQKSNAVIKEYTAAPVYFSGNETGSHEWLIEFEKQPHNLDYFTETLDNALKSLNSDYEAKRHKNIALRMPIVRALPTETFYKWLKSKNKLGGQYKVPRLSNERKYVEEIISLIDGTVIHSTKS